MTSSRMDAELRAAVDERLEQRRADARRRREKTEQDRAAKAARRTAGLRARHAAKLARLAEQDQDDQTAAPAIGRGDARTGTATPTRARARGEPDTMTTDQPDEPGAQDAPERRKGRRCGWQGKDRYDFGAQRLRVALTALARDPDPAARRTGVEISDQAADALHALATRADNATTRARRADAKAERLRGQVDQLLQEPGRPAPTPEGNPR